MGCLSEVGVLEKAVDLFFPCVSARISWLNVRESADRPGPWMQCTQNGGRFSGLEFETGAQSCPLVGKDRKLAEMYYFTLDDSREFGYKAAWTISKAWKV